MSSDKLEQIVSIPIGDVPTQRDTLYSANRTAMIINGSITSAIINNLLVALAAYKFQELGWGDDFAPVFIVSLLVLTVFEILVGLALWYVETTVHVDDEWSLHIYFWLVCPIVNFLLMFALIFVGGILGWVSGYQWQADLYVVWICVSLVAGVSVIALLCAVSIKIVQDCRNKRCC
jgi:hypothetical protein